MDFAVSVLQSGIPADLALTLPRLALSSWPHVYIHVPFCGRRCSYCDFAIAVRRDVPVSEFVDAIMAEMVARGIGSLDGPPKTIYFGGGTPSKLGGTGVEHLLHRMRHLASVDKFSTSTEDIEITLEANPEDVTGEAAERWVAAGVNRVSLGVQSFDPQVLEWMHRGHGPDRAAAAARILKDAGIQEISADLIFSVPQSLKRSWTTDLERVLELDVDHLSLYGLTVESQTPLGRWTARGEVTEAPEERYEAEFLEAHERLVAAGYEHYEVSNYARPGRRARHNSAYWTGVPYLGLGPSAHGFDGQERRWNASAYAEWLKRVQAGRDPVEGRETVRATAGSLAATGAAKPIAGGTEEERSQAAERVYLGLRTTDGLELTPAELPVVGPWIQAGWARMEGARLVLTPSGWLRLDSLAAALI